MVDSKPEDDRFTAMLEYDPDNADASVMFKNSMFD